MKTFAQMLEEVALDEIRFNGESKATWTATGPVGLFENTDPRIFKRVEFEYLLAAIKAGDVSKKVKRLSATLVSQGVLNLGSQQNMVLEKVFVAEDGVWLLAYQVVSEETFVELKGLDISFMNAVRCETATELIRNWGSVEA